MENVASSKSPSAGLPSAVEWAHRVIRERVSPGSWVVDATVGNGHDTVFLAHLVGSDGEVRGYDIQEAAIESARARLRREGIDPSCFELLCVSHETLADTLPSHWQGRIRAFMFNLGYLPGGDKSVITETRSTLRAVQSALDWLAVGGVMTVVLYPGHPGGEAEADAVRQLGASLEAAKVEVQQLRPINRSAHPPECWVFLKRAP